MEEPKPKVAPRSSLLKKSVTQNGTDGNAPSSRPVLPSKPKTLPAKPTNISTNTTKTVTSTVPPRTEVSKSEKIATNEPHLTLPTKDKAVKVCNKLKISASDLNKLRYCCVIVCLQAKVM